MAIEECLSRLGKFLSASRCYIMMEEKDGRYLRNSHEWVDDSSGPAMFSWPLYDYEYDIPSLKSILATGFVHTAVAELPPDVQEVLRKQGVKTVVLAPLVRDGRPVGLLGADYCDRERRAPEGLESVFTGVAGLLAIAVERKLFQQYRKKLQVIRQAVADLDPLPAIDLTDAGSATPAKPMTLLDAEKRLIVETLEQYNGNKLKTARHLGLTWPSLDRRCKKLGIEVKRR
ncbi:MAG: GAF domain-containing protein [Planctomycetes bacterium]|nr:GAF domain-containing protein [Planctomycetota bacterium]